MNSRQTAVRVMEMSEIMIRTLSHLRLHVTRIINSASLPAVVVRVPQENVLSSHPSDARDLATPFSHGEDHGSILSLR